MSLTGMGCEMDYMNRLADCEKLQEHIRAHGPLDVRIQQEGRKTTTLQLLFISCITTSAGFIRR